MGDLTDHFSRHEFACRCGCGFDGVDPELVTLLEEIRQHYDRPVIVQSGCRCENHNRRVGGAVLSWHRYGKAADIRVKGLPPEYIADYLEECYPDTLGIGRYRWWTHVDIRQKRARW